MKKELLRFRRIYYIDDNNHSNWRLMLGIIGSLIIIMIGGWWWPATLVAFWSILEIDHLINIDEKIQLRRYSGFYDLIQRCLVLYQVKKMVDEEANGIASVYKYSRGGQIKVPFVNVYIDHRYGFKGYIEIELSTEFDKFLNSDTICTQLTSQLKYLNERYVVTGKKLSSTGNMVIFTLEDLNVDNQIEILNQSDLRSINNKVILDQNHLIDWEKEYHAVISGTTGSGKTMLIEYLIAQAKESHWDIHILDPKQSDLDKIKDTDQIAVADEKESMLDLLHETVEEMQNAQRAYKENSSIKLTPHLVVVDELAALKAMLDRKQQQQLLDDLKQIALLGRQAKFHLVVGIQQANANNISTEIREQMGIKILLGNSAPSARKFLFEDCELEVPLAEGIGQGLISINNEMVSPFKAPLIEIDLIKLINNE